MGLATLVALDDDASRDRALAELFDSVTACDASKQVNALEQLRRTLRPSERARVRPHAHAFAVARHVASVDRELLRGDELRGLVSEALRYAKPCLLQLEHLMRLLVSFQPEATPRAAASILDAIVRVTRWWPVYPRALADDVGVDGGAARYASRS